MSGNPELAPYNIDTGKVAKDVLVELVRQGYLNPFKTKAKRKNWESLMAREYCQLNFPNNLKWYRHEVGPLPPGPDQHLYLRTRRWADAIILVPEGVLILEFKMKPVITAVSQLFSYMQSFPETPEFYEIKDLPVSGRVICSYFDRDTASLAKQWGIHFEVYEPSFYAEWKAMYVDIKR